MARTAISPVTRDACAVLGLQVRDARIERGWTASMLAATLGVSEGTITRIEHGEPSVAVGTVLEAGRLVGVNPFGADREEIARLRRRGEERIALIPQRVRQSGRSRIDDDF